MPAAAAPAGRHPEAPRPLDGRLHVAAARRIGEADGVEHGLLVESEEPRAHGRDAHRCHRLGHPSDGLGLAGTHPETAQHVHAERDAERQLAPAHRRGGALRQRERRRHHADPDMAAASFWCVPSASARRPSPVRERGPSAPPPAPPWAKSVLPFRPVPLCDAGDPPPAARLQLPASAAPAVSSTVIFTVSTTSGERSSMAGRDEMRRGFCSGHRLSPRALAPESAVGTPSM